MGPAAGFDEHGDLTGHRQPARSGQEGADAPGCDRPSPVDRNHRRLQSDALETPCHPGLELLRQRLHGSSGRDRAYGTRSCTATLAEHGRMPLRRVLLLSESQAGRRIAAKGYRAVHDIDIGRVASAGGDRDEGQTPHGNRAMFDRTIESDPRTTAPARACLPHAGWPSPRVRRQKGYPARPGTLLELSAPTRSL